MSSLLHVDHLMAWNRFTNGQASRHNNIVLLNNSLFTFLTTSVRLSVLVIMSSCATPTEKLRVQATNFGFEEIKIQGNPYQHISFSNLATPRGNRLHVYLEGDGSPWLTPEIVATDPTTREPVMLRLMALDTNTSLYLGRPCYFGLAQTDRCSAVLWTHRRYSEEVVNSMRVALDSFLQSHPFSELVFFGHSGGGTLAVLLSNKFPETLAVVTLAGNLDIDAWTDHHGFSRLQGSINPAADQPLNRRISEFHYVGSEDKNILPLFVFPRAKSRPGIKVRLINGFDHACCWQRIWPEVLREIANLP